MEDWINCPLGEILNFRRGHDLPHTEMAGGDIPVAGSNGIIGFHNEASPISPCITIGRSGNVGIPFMYNRAWAHNTTLYIDDFKGNDPLYIFYLLKTLPLSSFGGGSAVPTLNRNHIHPLIVKHCTNVSVQRRIASVLKSFDDKIELNNRINHNLEDQAQTLYKSYFVDFEPFKGGKFVDSELGLIPEGWRVGSIYEYAKVIYGAPYKSSLFNESGDGLPLIRIRDLKDCSPQFYSPEVLPNTEYVLKGDIVAGMDADFTPYIWKGSKGLLNQRVCKFVPISESISRYYIMMMVKPELEFVSSYKVGTTVSHLGKSDIDRFTVLLPPVEVIERYSRIVDSILEQIVTNSTEAAVLTEQRNTLLPQLMSGKINC